MARNHVNNYGLPPCKFVQWQTDYMSGALKPDVESYKEGYDISKKVYTFTKCDDEWRLVYNPPKTKPVTTAEDGYIAVIRANYKICDTKINKKYDVEKDADMKALLLVVVEANKEFEDIWKKATGKAKTVDQAEKFLSCMNGQEKKAMTKIAITDEIAEIKSAVASYKAERTKRDDIVDETQGVKPEKCKALNTALDSMIKAVEMLNDPETDANGKTVYPYNSLITKINMRFRQLKKRTDAKADSGSDK